MGDFPTWGADRLSRITSGTRLLYGDLHNHSLFSDGAGDPERAFAQMRAAGLDVAALTDHASIPRHHVDYLDPADYPDEEALALARMPPHSIDAAGWARTAELADAADVPGEFTAIRGFEWTEPWLGHANVWFSEAYLHVRTPGRVEGLHAWLREREPQALFGYNHPGREPGRFHDFAPAADLAPRMVALEIFNRYDDYLFEGWCSGGASPLLACLDAGWRPGLAGVSDEHSRSYGLVGKGRTGIWVRAHNRAGVREALRARRTFATREAGLRLDATLDGVRMGGVLDATRPAGAAGAAGAAGTAGTAGPVRVTRTLVVDVDSGPLGAGRDVQLQLLGGAHGGGASGRSGSGRSGSGRAGSGRAASGGAASGGAAGRRRRRGNPEGGAPAVVATAAARIGQVTTVTLELPVDATPWLVLRVGDPTRVNGTPGPEDHPGSTYGLAYASPWFLDSSAVDAR